MDSVTPTKDRSGGSRRITRFKIVAVALGILIGMVIVEAALRVIERVRGSDRATPTTIADPLLGQRLAPYTFGHDANGFRNASVRARVDIVALGDSQTWGVNAHSSEPWPQQLERQSGQSVYNMGVGGYGPVQYWALTDEALSFAPKVIVVGLYFGNDLYDAYWLAYENERYSDLRSRQVSDQIKIDTIKLRASLFWDQEKIFHDSYGRSSPSGWSFWLRAHSATGRLLNRSGLWPGATDVDYEIDKAWAGTYPDNGAVCEDADVRTVFTTAYRLTGLDLDDPRIVEGLNITKETLWMAEQKDLARGTQQLVLLIPTKETVYADLMKGAGRLNGNYARLVEMESRAREQVKAWCVEKHMKCVDALPDLRSALARRERIYPSNTESHPNADGYGVLAATVRRALQN